MKRHRARDRVGRLACLLCAVAGAWPAQSYELQQFSLRHLDDHYALALTATLHADATRVYALLREPRRAPDINPGVHSVRAELLADGSLRVDSVAETCFAAICRSLAHAQQLRFDPDPAGGGTVSSVTVPMPGSNFGPGTTEVTLTTSDATTSVLRLRSIARPLLWLPPLLGPWAVMQTMRREALRTLANLEALAR